MTRHLCRDPYSDTGYRLRPALVVVDADAFVSAYYRKKDKFPSTAYPRFGDPDIDKLVYSLFVRPLPRLPCVN
jgi:hypothetical protein